MAYNIRAELDDLGIHYHHDLVDAILAHLGPAANDADASLVACSDKSERETIKENFIKGKLGVDDEELADRVIEEICDHLGAGNRKKHRATFYYLLVGRFGKEEIFLEGK